MTKTRLEAFSDGVFAIVITLLILNIHIPEVDYAHLKTALIGIIPNLISYVMSFLVIGLYWVSHHRSFLLVKKTDSIFLWMNTILLLCISFMPFPTSLLGQFPFTKIPLIIYGANLIAANSIGFIMLIYLKYHPELWANEMTHFNIRKQIPIYIGVNFCYLIAILLAGTCPKISYGIYIFILLFLIVVYQSKSLIKE